MSQFIEMLQSSKTKMPLESVCSYMGKGISPKYVDVSTVATVNQACVHWDGQRLENVKYHNADIAVKKRTLQEGDVLLNATGNGTLGRSCVFHCPTDNKTYINDGHVIALSTNRSVIYPEVLNVYFSLPDTQGEIYRQYVTGSTNQVDIVFTDIKKMMIPIPPMELQTKFVNIMEQADKSGFDGRKSQFIEMFGNERIEDCKWQNLPMGHVFEISSSRRVLKEQWTSDGVPFLRVRDMVDLAQGKELNNEAFISEKYYNKLSDDDGKVREGDIIISATSTIGKCYLIKKGDRFYYKDADILRLRKQKEINCSYFMYAFNMPTIAMQVEESIGKTTVGHFLISKAQNIKIPMPPIELQVQFESILHQADKSGSVLQHMIAC